MRKKIGECLVQAGLITETDLQTALVEHKRSGERLGTVLVRLNLASERQIAKTLAYQLGFSYVNLAENPPDPAAVILIPKEVALKRTCVATVISRFFTWVCACSYWSRARARFVCAVLLPSGYPNATPTVQSGY